MSELPIQTLTNVTAVAKEANSLDRLFLPSRRISIDPRLRETGRGKSLGEKGGSRIARATR